MGSGGRISFEEAVIDWGTEVAEIQPISSIRRLQGGWDNPIFRLFLEAR